MTIKLWDWEKGWKCMCSPVMEGTRQESPN